MAGIVPIRQAAPMFKRKLGSGFRFYLIGAAILLVGLSAALAIYLKAADGPLDVLGYEFVDGTAYAVDPADSKMYRHQLERFGGKSALFADDLNRWFTSLWHGKGLAKTVALLSVVLAFAFIRAGMRHGRGSANEDER